MITAEDKMRILEQQGDVIPILIYNITRNWRIRKK